MCTSLDARDKRLRCSALISDGTTNVLIDCGPDVRQQLLPTGIEKLDAVLITHEHNDHLIGLDDLRPFIFRQKEPVRIYAEERVQDSIRERFAYAFAKTPYPGAPRFELLSLKPHAPLHIGSLPEILPLRILHGSLPILGFRVSATAYLTDVKEVPPPTRQGLRGLDTLVTSALHHHRHHSHMTVEEAIEFAREIGATETCFIHMSHLAGRHAELSDQLPEGITLGYDGRSFAL